MKTAVIMFPGSNCDHDSFHIARQRGHDVRFVWHKDADFDNVDLVILPGGFSYGDYLRAGAIARFSPVIQAVKKHAERGGHILGICNGFQILTETGLLPGALMMNRDLRFICKHQYIRVETTAIPYTSALKKGIILDIPIAHKEGNYFIDDDGYRALKDRDGIVFRYCSGEGVVDDASNPNGSVDNIAGVCDASGRILGMMPHPERAAEDVVVSQAGKEIFASLEAVLG